MRSPGRPPVHRELEREFWLKIAQGLSSEDAAVACSVSPAVGGRWFRQGGGMPRMCLEMPSGRFLNFADREAIALLRAQRLGVREIARRLGRSPSRCGETPRRAAANSTIERRWRSGSPSKPLAVRRWPSWPTTTGCSSTSRTGSLGCSPGRAGQLSPALPWPGAVAGTVGARTDGGLGRGALSRSLAGCLSTSPTMRPCGCPRGDLPGAVRAGPWCAASGAHGVPAHGTGAARPERARTRSRGRGFISRTGRAT